MPPLKQKHYPSEHEPPKRNWKQGFAVITAGAVAWLGSQLFGASLALPLLAPFENLGELEDSFATYLIIQALLVACILGFARLFKANAVQLGLGRVKNWKYLLALPLIYIAAMTVSQSLAALVAYLFSSFDMDQIQDLGLPPIATEGDLIVLGLLLVVAVPLAEEFLFRGYLFGLLRRMLPFWLVTLVTSALFALAHGQWNVAIDTFVLGIALAYLREHTGSIWTGVALHALKNFVAFLLLFVYNIV